MRVLLRFEKTNPKLGFYWILYYRLCHKASSEPLGTMSHCRKLNMLNKVLLTKYFFF